LQTPESGPPAALANDIIAQIVIDISGLQLSNRMPWFEQRIDLYEG